MEYIMKTKTAPAWSNRWAIGPVVFAVTILLIFGARQSSGQNTTAVPSFEGPPGETAAWPIPKERVGEAIAQLPEIITAMMAETGVPGVSVAVVHGGEVAYAAGFGEREVGTGEKVDADTVFQLASLSKSIGATVVAGVVSDGKIAWDDPVISQLPGFALNDPWVTEHVTFADLYAHRSGLPDHAGDLLEDLGYDREQVLERLRFVTLDPFRAVYHYTNFGMTAAAEAVAAAEGTSWEELSRTRLYDRLGMSRTSSVHADFIALDNRAAPHQLVDGRWQFVEQRQPDAQSPAGGVSSTANDMARWLRMFLAGGSYEDDQIIDSRALLAVQTPHMRSSPKRSMTERTGFYGLGLGVSSDETARVRLSHSGAFLLGAATTFVMLPAADVGIVVLTNGQPVGLPESIAAVFVDLVKFGGATRDWLGNYQPMFAQMLAGPPSRLDNADRPMDPVAALADGAYVGAYANDFYGPLRINAGDSGLVLTAGPNGMAFPLHHWDGNTFTLETQGENRSGISAVDFTVGPDGIAISVVIEKWDEPEGIGNFVRL